MDSHKVIPYRTVGAWSFTSSRRYENPFAEVDVDVHFISPSGNAVKVPAFYDGTTDGKATWRVRFNPNEEGTWQYNVTAQPADSDLESVGRFEVEANDTRGYLVSTPGEAWGFHFESGEPAFLLGDTTYNLFGMAHAAGSAGSGDVPSFLRRRAEQGFGLLRVRLQVSRFHGPHGYSEWQEDTTWPWGGSTQAPQFDRFNLDYFRTVDEVMWLAEELGLGFEMIMEAWGFEYPFNDRSVFLPEWENLWMRYLIARYDAFNAVYIWTLLNEYEYYPDGDWRYNPVADRWAIRKARWLKQMASHGHIVAGHNGPRVPPFAERFDRDPEAVDTIMFQTWGSMGDEDSWLAAGIETDIDRSLAGWPGSVIFAEWGYERNPDLPLNLPHHKNCSIEHTRRGAWRGTFSALNIIHGFENSWGPFMVLDEDQPGLAQLLHVHRFFTELVPFHQLQRAPELVLTEGEGAGTEPLALATPEQDVVAVYLPVGGPLQLDLPADGAYEAQWFDPRTGDLSEAESDAGKAWSFEAPEGEDDGHPWDFVLLLNTAKSE